MAGLWTVWAAYILIHVTGCMLFEIQMLCATASVSFHSFAVCGA